MVSKHEKVGKAVSQFKISTVLYPKISIHFAKYLIMGQPLNSGASFSTQARLKV
jgi:hypothetical protein